MVNKGLIRQNTNLQQTIERLKTDIQYQQQKLNSVTSSIERTGDENKDLNRKVKQLTKAFEAKRKKFKKSKLNFRHLSGN